MGYFDIHTLPPQRS